jgi:capsular polysaccharide biosynthesis protein
VWDPSGSGRPTDFDVRTHHDYIGELSVDDGYLDGHHWILDRDLTIFTCDIPALSDFPVDWYDAAPYMETDYDTHIERTTTGHTVALEPRGTSEFADGIVAVSAEPTNWGAFLLRVLPKLVDAGRHDVPVLAYVDHANQRLMAELAGVRPTNLVAHQPSLRYAVRNIQLPIVPTSGLWVSPRLKNMYRELAERARAWHPDASGISRVYLSRRGSIGRNSPRHLVNEEQLISELETRGFHVLYPEDQPAPLVTAMVSQADLVVALGGAGLFNVVFAPDHAVVIDVEGQPNWLDAHTSLLAGAARRWGLFYGYPADEEFPRGHHPYAVDIPALLRVLEEVT